MIKNLLESSTILNFNLVERDRWVETQSSLIPVNSSVLDVGAGSCPYRKYFTHCDYKTQDFAELSPEQLRGKIGYDKMDYICDATQIPVQDSSFDFILCTEVLEHVPEPIKLINEFSRLLKYGGKLLLTAPLGSGIHQEPYHFYGGYTPTPSWYEKFLTDANFKINKIEPNGGFFKHYSQESIRFARMTAPWKINTNFIWRILWSPIWLLLSLWLVLIMPVICHILDRFDEKTLHGWLSHSCN